MTATDHPSEDAPGQSSWQPSRSSVPAALSPRRRSVMPSQTPPRPRVDHHLLATYDCLLDRYMPASILVDSDSEVLHVFGGAEKYLRHRGGRASHHILDLLDDPLRMTVGVGLQQVLRSGEAVSYPEMLYEGYESVSEQGPDPLRRGQKRNENDSSPKAQSAVRRGSESQVRLAVAVEPLLDPSGAIEKLLILLRPADSHASPRSQEPQRQMEDATQQLIRNLETELQHTQADLQAAIDNLAYANEGLQASNEALAISNEKLHFANEELRGINDALRAINAESERAIGEGEQEYRGTLEYAGVGIAHLDAEGRWIRVNSRLCEIVGYNRDELLGMSFHQLTDPEDLEADVERFESLLRGELDGYSHESRYHHRDGHIVWVLLTASRRLDADGKPVDCIAVIQNISDRKEAEIALQKARRMADSANRAKSNFMTNMSHELRSPMTAVLGFADMLADEIEVPEQLDKVQTLKRNGEYLLRLLDEILDLSKIESRRSGHDTEPCDFLTLVDEVEILMRGLAEQIAVPLHFHFPSLLPRIIYTSGTRVRQILMNLIANALKSPMRGDVNAVIRYSEQQGEEDQGQAYIEFEIADTAIDLSGDLPALSFSPFIQPDPNVAQPVGGNDSSLRSTKRLVSALGGTIEVATETSGGNIFLARLPVGEAADLDLTKREAPAEDAPALPAASPLRCIEGRILVADDRRDIWQVTKYFLERCGAEVAVAEDGRQAIDAVQAAAKNGAPFDLILLDMQMPIMNGLETVRELRGAGFSLPIIALTADAMKGERKKCLAAGCNDYLTKPIDAALLTETVAKHLGESS